LAEIVRFSGQDGSFMLVELDAPVRGASRSDVEVVVEPRGRGPSEAATRLEESLDSVQGASVALMSTVEALQKRDDGMGLSEVSLDLSLVLGVEGGVIVAKGKAEAQASVKLTWRAAG
jgi:hypothetical protein